MTADLYYLEVFHFMIPGVTADLIVVPLELVDLCGILDQFFQQKKAATEPIAEQSSADLELIFRS